MVKEICSISEGSISQNAKHNHLTLIKKKCSEYFGNSP